MIKIYKSMENNDIIEIEHFEKKCWIDLINPTDDEVESVVEATGIYEDMIKASLDEEESARFEVDDGNTLFIVDVPIIEENDDWYNYSTIPLGIAYNENYLLTVSLKENSTIKDITTGRVKQISTLKPINFMLNFMYKNSVRFLQYLKLIDKSSHRVQAELHRSMKNKELIQLLEIEKSLVYFSTSLTANERVFDKIARIESVNKIEDYKDLYEDAVIENRQAIEMCNIYRDILSGTMDAFASVISNNVNSVMKMLAVITLVLTVPMLIASLWGMNVPVPFENFKYGFWILLGASMILSGIGSVFLIKMTDTIRYKRNKKNKK